MRLQAHNTYRYGGMPFWMMETGSVPSNTLPGRYRAGNCIIEPDTRAEERKALISPLTCRLVLRTLSELECAEYLRSTEYRLQGAGRANRLRQARCNKASRLARLGVAECPRKISAGGQAGAYLPSRRITPQLLGRDSAGHQRRPFPAVLR